MIWDKYRRYAFLYDLDDILFLGTKQKLRKRVVELANLKEGMLVLDLMVGTAETSLLAAKVGCNVVSVDFSKQMLSIADRKIMNEVIQNITLIQADSEYLPFPKSTFDVIFCTYGLDTVIEPEPVLIEMLRVAKSGAPIIAAHKSSPKSKILTTLDTMLKLYFHFFWGCRNVELRDKFKKIGITNIKEEAFYFCMGKVIIGFKP
jgi:demethylmenaquinone methyltransferase/2-methoxy-6-polyprenyl-1,4-benzoquinol methylase